MNDNSNTRLGLITDGTREGTRFVDPETEQTLPDFPAVRNVAYGFHRGVARLTLEIMAVPSVIEGVVRRVHWVHAGIGLSEMNYTPYPEQNPMGCVLRFECDGTFAGCRPLNEQTANVFAAMPFTDLSWVFEDGECSITVTCLIQPRP